MHIWNSENTTYYDKGKKAYGNGDVLPPAVIAGMGEETFAEYSARGLIINGTPSVAVGAPELKTRTEADVIARKLVAEAEAEAQRKALLGEATDYGLKPHYKAGIPKLRAMIDDYKALEALKKEAISLNIEDFEHLPFDELTALIDFKKSEAANEFDH